MTPGRNWRRTASERNGHLVQLLDDWSLTDSASGLAIARIHAEPDGGWRCVCRSIAEGALKDSIMAWFKTGKEAKDYAEARPTTSITLFSARGRRRKSCGGRG